MTQRRIKNFLIITLVLFLTVPVSSSNVFAQEVVNCVPGPLDRQVGVPPRVVQYEGRCPMGWDRVASDAPSNPAAIYPGQQVVNCVPGPLDRQVGVPPRVVQYEGRCPMGWERAR
jgi:hypothetical protein